MKNNIEIPPKTEKKKKKPLISYIKIIGILVVVLVILFNLFHLSIHYVHKNINYIVAPSEDILCNICGKYLVQGYDPTIETFE